MRIAIASDHVGYPLRLQIADYLQGKGYVVIDFGPDGEDRCDYPVYGEKVARAVATGECDLGVLTCGTGIGISLAANKVKGIRAAVCSETYSAKMARMHNDANVVAFGARVVGLDVAKEIVDAFLNAAFEGGRHQNRVDMISALEERLEKENQ